MAVELLTRTPTEEGGADGAMRERERESQDRNRLCEMHSLAAIVVPRAISCSVPPPPVIVAVTVMEYSVPSSRPGSLYIVSLPAMGEMVLESVKQSVSVAE